MNNILDKFFASKVAILSYEPPFIVIDLLIVIGVPSPINVLPPKLITEDSGELSIKLCKSLKVYEFAFKGFDFKESL